METIKFYDDESGKELEGEIVGEKWVPDALTIFEPNDPHREQKFFDVRVRGIRWAVCAKADYGAICEESNPEEYRKIF